MYMMHGVVFSLVPAVVLLAISFFVLLAARKSDSQLLKTFGYVIAVLLWVAAALVFGSGISGCHSQPYKKHMMGERMGRTMMPHSEFPQQGEQATEPSK